jgi:hypothetical protein
MAFAEPVMTLERSAAVRKQTPQHVDSPTSGDIIKFIPVRNLSDHSIVSLVETLGLYDAVIVPEPSSPGLTVMGTPDVVAYIEEVVRRLDHPPKNIQLTAYLIKAVDAAPARIEVPPDLRGLTAELGNRNFTLVERFMLRAGGANNRFSIDSEPYRVSVGQVEAHDEDEPPFILVGRLTLHRAISEENVTDASEENVARHMGTPLQLPLGQAVVVGEVHLAGTNESVVLVVKGEVVD